ASSIPSPVSVPSRTPHIFLRDLHSFPTRRSSDLLTAGAGRLFSPSDMDLATPAADSLALISYDFWQRQFHGAPSAVGRSLRIEGVPFTIIGVTPREFTGLSVLTQPDVTIPLPLMPLINGHRPSTALKTRPGPSIRILARLKP